MSVHFCLCRPGLHICHSVSPLLSVALVSTLVTVSVHFCLCRLGLHTCHSVSPLLSVALVSTLATVSVHFCLCRLGLHTCYSVSQLLSLSPWSPHLPQCQSTASSSVSYRRHHWMKAWSMLTDGIVKIHVHISFHCQGLNPNPLVNTCLQSLHQLPLGLRCPN